MVVTLSRKRVNSAAKVICTQIGLVGCKVLTATNTGLQSRDLHQQLWYQLLSCGVTMSG